MPEPTLDRVLEAALGYERDWNLPHCFGAIDGKHIRLKKPANSHGEHWNYKKFHSIVLQGIWFGL